MSGYKITIGGMSALLIAHCAGMIDLIALPVWVGALVERFSFSPQQAGGLVTLFLLGAVAASLVVSPRLNRLNQKFVATVSYGLATAAFLAASTQSTLLPLAGLHILAGLSVGTGLSIVHGTIGRSQNPHRLFAYAGIAIGLFAIILLTAIPQLLIAYGGAVLFRVFALVMAIATTACALLLVNPPAVREEAAIPFNRAIWCTIIGISIMTFNQAMVFSFVEVIGKARGFGAANVFGVLIALGLVNFIFPAPLAALLQKHLPATYVVQIGPAVQAVLAVVVTSATALPLWAPAAAVFIAVQIFTHTFAFGLLAMLDPSGRATAVTPAMLMIGAAFGPIIGGALGQNFGFGALGVAAVGYALIAIAFFTMARTAGIRARIA